MGGDAGQLWTNVVPMFRSERRSLMDPLAETVAATAVALGTTARTTETPLVELRERHLQVAAGLAAATVYSSYGQQVAAYSERVVWPEFPGVGRVDVAIRSADGYPAFLELKWCYTADKLAEAVWDLVKLSIPLGRAVTAESVLVYGAPGATWRSALGHELFEAGRWPIEDLRSRYAAWWRYWQSAVRTRPAAVPELISTQIVARVAIPDGFDETWELRAVEVSDTSDSGLSGRHSDCALRGSARRRCLVLRGRPTRPPDRPDAAGVAAGRASIQEGSLHRLDPPTQRAEELRRVGAVERAVVP